eukprot:Awhi_evm1s2335
MAVLRFIGRRRVTRLYFLSLLGLWVIFFIYVSFNLRWPVCVFDHHLKGEISPLDPELFGAAEGYVIESPLQWFNISDHDFVKFDLVTSCPVPQAIIITILSSLFPYAFSRNKRAFQCDYPFTTSLTYREDESVRNGQSPYLTPTTGVAFCASNG